MNENIENLLELIYGKDVSESLLDKFQLIQDAENAKVKHSKRVTASNLSVNGKESAVIPCFEDFVRTSESSVINPEMLPGTYSGNSFSTIHILPFFSSPSNDGFSVVDYRILEKELVDFESQNIPLLAVYKRMFDVRKKEAAFNPEGKHVVLDSPVPLSAILRTSGDEKVLCLFNISGRILKYFAHWDVLSSFNRIRLYDIINDQESSALIISKKSNTGSECSAMLTLDPWEVVWLK